MSNSYGKVRKHESVDNDRAGSKRTRSDDEVSTGSHASKRDPKTPSEWTHGRPNFQAIPYSSTCLTNPWNIMSTLNAYAECTFTLNVQDSDKTYVVGKSYYVSPDLVWKSTKTPAKCTMKTVTLKVKRAMIVQVSRVGNASYVEGESPVYEIGVRKYAQNTYSSTTSFWSWTSGGVFSNGETLYITRKPVFDAVVLSIEDKRNLGKYFVTVNNSNIGVPVTDVVKLNLTSVLPLEKALCRFEKTAKSYAIYKSTGYIPYEGCIEYWLTTKTVKPVVVCTKYEDLITYLVKNGSTLKDDTGEAPKTLPWPSYDVLKEIDRYVKLEL